MLLYLLSILATALSLMVVDAIFPGVVLANFPAAMVAGFEAATGHLGERLMQALEAGLTCRRAAQRAGGRSGSRWSTCKCRAPSPCRCWRKQGLCENGVVIQCA